MNKKIFNQVSKKFNLTPKQIESIYKLYWKTISKLLNSQDIKDIENNKGYKFRLPNIGQLNPNKQAIYALKKKHEGN